MFFKILRRPPYGGTPQNDSGSVNVILNETKWNEESLKNVELVFKILRRLPIGSILGMTR